MIIMIMITIMMIMMIMIITMTVIMMIIAKTNLQCRVLIIPFPAAAMIPLGPEIDHQRQRIFIGL